MFSQDFLEIEIMICALCGKEFGENHILKIRTISEVTIIPHGDECLTLETERVECQHEIPPLEVE